MLIPMNVGSLFRIADMFAIQKIYLSGNSPVPPNRKIRKTSRGADAYVPFSYETDPLSLLQTLKKEGFKIKAVHETPMHLLRAKRMIDDEGLFRTLKIGFKIMTHPKAKNRIFSMRKVFEKYEKQMVAYAIIAEKV